MRELYRMMDIGNIERLKDIVRTLEGEEWGEGEFWDIYWLVQLTRDPRKIKERTKELLGVESESTVTRIFLDLTVAITHYQKGEYVKVLLRGKNLRIKKEQLKSRKTFRHMNRKTHFLAKSTPTLLFNNN